MFWPSYLKRLDKRRKHMEKREWKEVHKSLMKIDSMELYDFFFHPPSSGIRSETLWRSSSSCFNDETEQIAAHPLPHLFELKPFFLCESVCKPTHKIQKILTSSHSFPWIYKATLKIWFLFYLLFPLIKEPWKFFITLNCKLCIWRCHVVGWPYMFIPLTSSYWVDYLRSVQHVLSMSDHDWKSIIRSFNHQRKVYPISF